MSEDKAISDLADVVEANIREDEDLNDATVWEVLRRANKGVGVSTARRVHEVLRTRKKPKWVDLYGIDPTFTPPKTEVPRFEAGHGRPDLDMLHQVIRLLDIGEEPYYVREVVARYLITRPDDTKETT